MKKILTPDRIMIVEMYLNTGITYVALAKLYNISCWQTIQKWVNKYREVYLADGRIKRDE